MDEEKRKIAIVSGKGGVGKSLVASSLSILFGEQREMVAVDGDVDAPNLAIWLNEIGGWEEVIPVTTSFKPRIDYEKCNGCGRCIKNCRFRALEPDKKGKPQLNTFLCEGCGACEAICPQGAIELEPVQNGEIRMKETKYGFPLVVGNLFPGETGSGKIISELKKEVDKMDADLQVLDCSPGTGCPVIACLQDATFAVLVTEPTISAFSDLKRVRELVDYFGIPFQVIINKHGINQEVSSSLQEWAGERLLGSISYDKRIVKAISHLNPLMETDLKAKKELEEIFKNLNSILYG